MACKINRDGERYGKMTILITHHVKREGEKEWRCQAKCDCGTIKEVPLNLIRRVQTCGKCGILNRPKASRISLVGQIFGFLKIEKEHPGGREGYRCDCTCLRCGKVKEKIRLNHLKSGEIMSCGCYLKSISEKGPNRKHGFSKKHNQDIFYDRLVKMRQRCNIKSIPGYKDYGARGIYVWEHWDALDEESIGAFKNYLIAIDPDAEEKLKSGYQINRINNDSSYIPGNLNIITQLENAQNKRNTVRVTLNGEKISARGAHKILKSTVCYDTFKKRIKSGWTAESAAH